MLHLGDRIEFRDLTDADRAEVMMGCGGEPVREPQYLGSFLKIAGFPALAPKPREKWEQLRTLTQAGSQTLNTTSPDAITRFNKGAMFYAGVTSVANNHSSVPCNTLLLAASVPDITVDFVLDQAAVLQEETGDFYSLLNEVRPAIDPAENDQLFNISVAGAALMHYIVKESIEVEARDPDKLKHAFPELAGMFDTFELPPLD